MRSFIILLSAVALLSVGACAGLYVAGDGGVHADHKNVAADR